MTKLERLIEQLCPDGVEYKEFGEIATISRGASPRPIKAFLTNRENGVHWIKIGDVKTGEKYIESTEEFITVEGAQKSRAVKKGDFILSNSMSFGRPYILKIDGYIHDGWLSISGFEKNLLSDFLYYVLNSTPIQAEMRKRASFGGAVQNLNADIVRGLSLPVPPLEVQAEIVRILDKFTKLTTELTTELTNRKKQYEYYSRQLFVDAKNTQLTTLERLSHNLDSQRQPVTSNKRTAGIYPYYGASGIVDYVDDYIFDGDYLLISEDGANLLARNTPIAFSISGKSWVNNHAHVLKFDNYHTRRYVEIYLNSIDLSPYITGAAQPKLNQKNLNKIEIPLPPIEEQQHIVSILDRFDKLCNDISEGLPAEIEARQKQYEYYRDKLLTFKAK